MVALHLLFQSEDTSHGTPHKFDQEASTSRHPDKVTNYTSFVFFFILTPLEYFFKFKSLISSQTQRRLAQNREAARKSRLRKKV